MTTRLGLSAASCSSAAAHVRSVVEVELARQAQHDGVAATLDRFDRRHAQTVWFPPGHRRQLSRVRFDAAR